MSGSTSRSAPRSYITEDDADQVQRLIEADYPSKLAQKLQEDYQLHANAVTDEEAFMESIMVALAYMAYLLLSGVRPECREQIKVEDVKVIVSNHPSANMGEDIFELAAGDVALCIEHEQSKSKKKGGGRLEFPLVAEYPWEITCIEILHSYASDARFGHRNGSLLFPIRESSHALYFIDVTLTAVAVKCQVPKKITPRILRKLYATQLLQGLLDDFNIGKSQKGSERLQNRCSVHLTQSLKTVSSRLGHRVPFEGAQVAPYVDPRDVVMWAHSLGYHRHTLRSYGGLVRGDRRQGGTTKGLNWFADSDSDDELEEDTFGRLDSDDE